MMDLDEAEEQYNMAFRAEVDMMTEMMDIHGARYEYIFSNILIQFGEIIVDYNFCRFIEPRDCCSKFATGLKC